jgi:hypothetical protein
LMDLAKNWSIFFFFNDEIEFIGRSL